MSPFVQSPLRWFNLHPWWRHGAVSVWGARLRAPTFDRWLALRLHQARFMGVEDKRFLETYLRPGMTVVDIGANQGLYSLLLSRLAGKNGCVLAFEPDDMLYRALVENVALNGAETIQPHHLALGSQPGTMTLHRSLLNSGDNRLASKAETAGPREAVQIRLERLDRVLAGRRVDFIKMDVQGWEMEVFRGMQGLLDDPQNAAMAVYFEFWPQGLRDAGSEPVAPLDFLAANGFSIHRPQGSELGEPARDLRAVAGSIRPGAYTNLYAVRRAG